MFLQKIKKTAAILAVFFTMTGAVAADYDPYCEETYWDPCACDMPDFLVFADFILWQVHPEGLEFARKGGMGLT